MVLLIASDARFEQLVYALFDWGWALPEIVRYNMVFIVISLFVAAILRVSVLNEGIKDCQICEKLPYWSLGKIEIVMLLGTLNVLFFGFIAVQFSYFFGGDALVQSLDGLTYAKYARRGFFQLVTVAILVIVLLLFSHWSYKSATDSDSKVFTYLAAIMLLLTMTIELSAAHRMSLYTSVYGLTELRFYTSIFMAWLLLLFAWFSATVLRGKRAYFSFGAVVSALLCIVILHVVNPDAVIADVNLERFQEGQKVDVTYLASLSADAVPALYSALNTTVKTNFMCMKLWHKLQQHKVLKVDKNWRYFNFSRYQARKLLMSENNAHCQLK